MSTVAFTATLGDEYEALFNGCQPRPEHAAEVDRVCDGILADRARYEAVQATTGVPWYVVAVIHNMESDRSFRCHLHNGDPLTARTAHVPEGRPTNGSPPFTWEASAGDALACRGLNAGSGWGLSDTLYHVEGYNGFGYRLYHPEVRTPYLWSFSDWYDSGKYVADGTWSATARSTQCGAAVLLRRLAERAVMEFPDQQAPTAGAPPLVPYATARPADPAVAERAEALQRWLNTLPGVFVKVDGVAGARTSDAVRQALGTYLAGDPRAA